LTEKEDKLPTLSGIARTFASQTNSHYVVGLWGEDLIPGLLWSGPSFHSPFGSPSLLCRPPSWRAPSWSWASFDGPINYPLGKLGFFSPRLREIAFKSAALDKSGAVTWGALNITGKVLPMDIMLEFSPKLRGYIERNADSFLPQFAPQARLDEPDVAGTQRVYCLRMAYVGCGSADCEHYAGCDMGFVYGLLLHRVGISRVGIEELGWRRCISRVRKGLRRGKSCLNCAGQEL